MTDTIMSQGIGPHQTSNTLRSYSPIHFSPMSFKGRKSKPSPINIALATAFYKNPTFDSTSDLDDLDTPPLTTSSTIDCLTSPLDSIHPLFGETQPSDFQSLSGPTAFSERHREWLGDCSLHFYAGLSNPTDTHVQITVDQAPGQQCQYVPSTDELLPARTSVAEASSRTRATISTGTKSPRRNRKTKKKRSAHSHTVMRRPSNSTLLSARNQLSRRSPRLGSRFWPPGGLNGTSWSVGIEGSGGPLSHVEDEGDISQDDYSDDGGSVVSLWSNVTHGTAITDILADEGPPDTNARPPLAYNTYRTNSSYPLRVPPGGANDSVDVTSQCLYCSCGRSFTREDALLRHSTKRVCSARALKSSLMCTQNT